jgi:hypothetical protein
MVRTYVLLIPVALSAVVAAGVLGAGTAVSQVLVVSVFALPLALSVWALLDMARRPSWVWALAGRSQPLWMTGILFGTMILVGGLLVSVLYLVAVRPELARIEEGELPVW